MRWVEHGTEGPAVLLVHGIPTSPALWRHVLPRLDGVRALAVDMVGYGQSIPAGIGRDISVQAQTGYLRRWLDHLGIDRAVFVGHDLGGGVAQIAAVQDPDRCAGLVLTNAIAYDSWPIPSVKALRATRGAFARLPDAALTGVLASLFVRGHDDLAMARESLDVHLGPYHAHDGTTALARQVEALDVNDTRAIADRLPGLGVPARVVWGLADQFQKARYGQRLARDLGAPAVGIRGGKHFTPEDHPDIIADVIRDLVADIG